MVSPDSIPWLRFQIVHPSHDGMPMGYDFIGRNGRRINLGYSHTNAFGAVLTEILDREVYLGTASDEECKIWAKALRENIGKLRFIKGRRSSFLLLQGVDVKRMFSGNHYRIEALEFEPSWEIAKELDTDWKELVLEVINFLDTCGGIVEYG